MKDNYVIPVSKIGSGLIRRPTMIMLFPFMAIFRIVMIAVACVGFIWIDLKSLCRNFAEHW